MILVFIPCRSLFSNVLDFYFEYALVTSSYYCLGYCPLTLLYLATMTLNIISMDKEQHV